MSNALNYLGIAKKAGTIEIGETNSGIACRAGKARVLLLAADASDNASRRADSFVFEKKTILVRLPYTKEQISAQTGTSGCSMAAITDIGLATVFLSALADSDESFREKADLIEKRNEKALMRKREALAHERNKKMGKSAKAIVSGKRRKNT